jgi:hypothetical protein
MPGLKKSFGCDELVTLRMGGVKGRDVQSNAKWECVGSKCAEYAGEKRVGDPLVFSSPSSGASESVRLVACTSFTRLQWLHPPQPQNAPNSH